jgi:hypothetical protein
LRGGRDSRERVAARKPIIQHREEIVDYLKSLKNPDIANSRSDELIVNLVGGKFDYWKNPEQRKLTFGFDEKSFPSAALTQRVHQVHHILAVEAARRQRIPSRPRSRARLQAVRKRC